MGYPQAASGAAPGMPVSTASIAQDPISNVLGQALQQCEDVEMRIKGLRDRLRTGPGERLGKEPLSVPPSGIISTSNELRNISTRLQELCSELETLL